MIEEIIKLIDAYWKFDNDQQPLSSWHDKQDLIKAVEQVKNLNTPEVSNLRCVDCSGNIEPFDAYCKHCGEVIP